MKKQKQNSNLNLNKMSYKLFLMVLFIFSFCFTSAQPVTINLPPGFSGGTLVYDILYANGKIFTYSSDGVSIYRASDNMFLNKIPFDNSGLFYGKFNPVYFNSRLAVSDQNLMVYNDEIDNKYVYVLTPKLKLLIINTTTNDYWISSILVRKNNVEEPLDQALSSQSGRSILRYDNNNNNNRLYILVSGRDDDDDFNCTGEFHVMKTIFGIYDIDYDYSPNVNGHFNLHYCEINGGGDTYGDQINNYVFNETNNYFYLVRLGTKNPISKAIIEIREIITNGSNLISSIDFENINGSGWFKMGKMLYIHEGNLHKIIVLPYRYPSGVVPEPKFCVIDGDNHDDVKYVTSPSKRIFDAAYLGENQDLVLCYAPDNNEIVGYIYQNTNVAIFHYNPTLENFVSTDDNFTEDFSIKTSDFDINASICLTKLNYSSALISKKDGIAKLEYDSNTETYDYNSLLVAEGNFFRKGATVGAKTYINNTVANGIEVFNNGQHSSIRTGYPVYHITANADGSKLYCFNKLNSYNTGLYIHDPGTGSSININSDGISDNNIETAIGDCIYNPFQDHFLISKFESVNAKIVVLNASDNTFFSEIDLEQELSGAQFAKEMFISPNGRLYIFANMQNSSNQYPEIFIYDANNYNCISHQTVETNFPYNEDFIYYAAHFCYNSHDESVYVTLTIQDLKLLPYNSEASSIYNYQGNPPPPPPPGKLLVIKDAIEKEFNMGHFPGKIICPNLGSSSVSSQYYGKLFFIGENLFEYDYLNPPNNENEILSYDHHFIDITYSSLHDTLFAVKDIQGSIDCPEHRKYEIWKIYYDANGDIQIEEFNNDGMPVDGQIASMMYNPYDGKIYVYQKIDAEKLGDTQVSLLSFDPANPVWETTPLGITSYFPEYDHTSDPTKFYFYNMTTPYIDPYDTAIYLPNGGHSCISKVFFETNEPLLLRAGWTWLSFPRLENRDYVGKVPAATVLNNNILPQNFNEKGELRNLPPQTAAGSENEITRVFDQGILEWVPGDNPLYNIWSTRGYKIELLPEEVRHINLHGTILLPDDPLAAMNLYAGLPNWIGYFLPYTMRVGDAFASIWDNISEIRHQDWAIANPSGNQPPVPDYILNFTLSYGDMVIVKVFDACTLYWPSNSNPEIPLSAPETQYFSYEEKADYTPFYVEMNPDSLPVEIAVYEDTTCVGASVVQDSIVEINGYLTDSLGYNPEISFISHYGLKAAGKTVKKYSVYNFKTNRMESRIIHSKEKADYYYISLKGGTTYEDEEIETSGDIEFKVYPNPFSNQTHFIYELKKPTKVGLYIYDTKGMLVTTLIDGNQTSGIYKLAWNGKNDSGKRLQPGVYYYKFIANGLNKNGKLVIIE
jgi:hypothetical protein